MSEIQFVWQGKNYLFSGIKIYPDIISAETRKKQIFRGQFLGDAPLGVEAEKDYVLLDIPFFDSEYPQDRIWDIDKTISGPHLREVLVLDDSANDVLKQLMTGTVSIPPPSGRCKMIEPLYHKLDAHVLKQMTPFERVDLLKQVCEALEELSKCQNQGRPIDAHRDLKLNNIMIEPGETEFRVRLIDFASIHHQNSTGTFCTITSRESTTPDDILGYGISEKTDIFALAGILAHAFGDKNPVAAILSDSWPRNGSSAEDAAEKMRKTYEKLRKKAANGDWIEHEANLSWDHKPREFMADIRLMFRRMCRIDPSERSSLQEVHDFFKQLMEDMARAKQNLRNLKNEHLYKKQGTVGTKSDLAVCLIDQRNLSENVYAYEERIRALWRKHDRILTVWADSMDQDEHEISDRLYKSVFSDAEAMVQAVRQVPDAKADAKSLLAIGMLFAKNLLRKSFPEGFHGEIHIFSPALLRDDQYYAHTQETPETAARKLKIGHPDAKIILHSDLGEVPPAYTWWDIRYQLPLSAASLHDPIDTGPGAWFLLASSGARFYVGRRENLE